MNSKLIFKLQNKVNFVKNTNFLHDYWCFILILPLLGLVLEPEMGITGAALGLEICGAIGNLANPNQPKLELYIYSSASSR